MFFTIGASTPISQNGFPSKKIIARKGEYIHYCTQVVELAYDRSLSERVALSQSNHTDRWRVEEPNNQRTKYIFLCSGAGTIDRNISSLARCVYRGQAANHPSAACSIAL
jgi:hypothetical protein